MWLFGSEYHKNLEKSDQTQYQKKLALSDRILLPDPYKGSK